MYGRGTSDDKGPGMAAYIALKALRDGGLIQGYSVKLVIGGNEEKGSNCLHYYFHTLKKPYPKAGFTPDGNFPLIYGEKGITNYELSGLVKLPLLQSIEAGTAHNAVIDLATAVLINDPTITKTLKKKRYRYTLKQEGKMMRLSIHGKAAHGSTPGIGVNAGVQLLDVLGDHYQYQPFQTLAKQYSDVYGKKLGLYVKTKLMGVTTFNVGLMSYKEGQLTMTVNYRYPETVKIKEVISELKKISPFKVKQSYDSPLLFIDPQSPMVKTLVKVYQQETGDNKTKPMTIGGGTYAKEAKNTLAFGSKFPGRNDFIHENDEKIDLIDYTRSISIYASAIDHLGRLYAPKK
jgi:succinyl-diaminopimelate desuccinylase